MFIIREGKWSVDKTKKKAKDKLDDVGDKLSDTGKDLGGDIVDAGTGLGSGIVDTGTGVGSGIIDTSKDFGNDITDAATDIGDEIKELGQQVLGIMGTAFDDLLDEVNNLNNQFYNIQTSSDALTESSDFAVENVNYTLDNFDAIVNSIINKEDPPPRPSRISSIKKTIGDVTEIVSNVKDIVNSDIGQTLISNIPNKLPISLPKNKFKIG